MGNGWARRALFAPIAAALLLLPIDHLVQTALAQATPPPRPTPASTVPARPTPTGGPPPVASPTSDGTPVRFTPTPPGPTATPQVTPPSRSTPTPPPPEKPEKPTAAPTETPTFPPPALLPVTGSASSDSLLLITVFGLGVLGLLLGAWSGRSHT